MERAIDQGITHAIAAPIAALDAANIISCFSKAARHNAA
jgi:hypothetical protein